MQLHLLPSDILVDLLQRIRDPTTLVRLASLSSSNLAAVARSDAVWAPTFQQFWGRAIYSKVLDSMQLGLPVSEPQSEGEGVTNRKLRKLHFERMARQRAGESTDKIDDSNTAAMEPEEFEASLPDWIPDWMLTPCLSSDQEKAQRECHQLWTEKPSMMVAFTCLAKLVPPDFNTDPSIWILRLTEAEEDVQTKARVAASFLHYFSPNRKGVHNVRKAAVKCMTVKSAHDPLSLAIRREYVRKFNVQGMSLPDAMRTLLTYGDMPTEAARICRLLWVFAAEFHCQHGGEESERAEPKKSVQGEQEAAPPPLGGAWVSQDVVYLLMWSLLVLNADAQNPHVKSKMQLHEWVKNTALALAGAGHVPRGVRPDGTLEDSEARPDVPAMVKSLTWGAKWGEQHRFQAAGAVDTEGVGSAVTAETLRAMYADVIGRPLLPHVSREPQVTKGLQRLTASAGVNAFSLSSVTSGLG